MRKMSNSNNLDLQKDQFRVLVEVLDCAENKQETEAVLRSLLTESERAVISQRLDILRMLLKKFKYSEIIFKLKVAPATISKAFDIYLKNGSYNKSLNIVLARYKYVPPKIETAYPNRGNDEPLVQGARSLVNQTIRQSEKANQAAEHD